MKKLNPFWSIIVVLTIITCNFITVGKTNAQTIPQAQSLIYSNNFDGFSAYSNGIYGWKIGASSTSSFIVNSTVKDTELLTGTAASTTGAVYNYNGFGIYINSSCNCISRKYSKL